MAASGIIYDKQHIKVIAIYDTTLEAFRRLRNAQTRGHKIRDRKYSEEALARFDVTTEKDFNENIDYMVTVKSLMSGKPVTLKRSQQGNPALDPSMEGYWSM